MAGAQSGHQRRPPPTWDPLGFRHSNFKEACFAIVTKWESLSNFSYLPAWEHFKVAEVNIQVAPHGYRRHTTGV